MNLKFFHYYLKKKYLMNNKMNFFKEMKKKFVEKIGEIKLLFLIAIYIFIKEME